MHDLVRLLTGSAADFLDDYFESDILKGYIASSGIIGTKVGPMSQGSGLVLLFHSMGEHDGHFGAWAFHKGGNGGFTQVLARAAQAYGAEILLNSPVDSVITKEGRAVGVALDDGTELTRRRRGQRARPAAHVHPAGRAARAAERPGREHQPDTSSRARRPRSTSPSTALPKYPALGDRTDQYRGFINIGPSMEYLERAFDDAKYGWYSQRPYIDVRDPVDRRPRHGAARQARDVAASSSTRPTTSRAATGTPSARTSATPCRRTLESFFPGFGDLVLHREVVTPLDIERVVGLTEGNIFAGEFFAPQMYFFRPAPGLEPVPHPDRGLLPVRLGHPPRRLRDGRARASSPASRSSRT